MPRARVIHPSFLSSEHILEVGLPCWFCFLGLILNADDYGILRNSPVTLKRLIFPHTSTRLYRPCDVARHIQALASAKILILYEHDGRDYIQIANWGNWQKVDHPSRPKYPAPSAADLAAFFREGSRGSRRERRGGEGRESSSHTEVSNLTPHQTSGRPDPIYQSVNEKQEPKDEVEQLIDEVMRDGGKG